MVSELKKKMGGRQDRQKFSPEEIAIIQEKLRSGMSVREIQPLVNANGESFYRKLRSSGYGLSSPVRTLVPIVPIAPMTVPSD